MQGKGLTPSKLYFSILSPSGQVLENSETFTGLADCVADASARLSKEYELSYYKAYRAVREFGMYSVQGKMPWQSAPGGLLPCVVLIMPLRGLEVEPGLAPVQSQADSKPAPTPLEVLIAEAQQAEPGLAPVQSQEGQKEAPQATQTQKAEFSKGSKKKVAQKGQKAAKKGTKTQAPAMLFYTVTYSKRNVVTGKVSEARLSVQVQAINADAAQLTAVEQLGGKLGRAIFVHSSRVSEVVVPE